MASRIADKAFALKTKTMWTNGTIHYTTSDAVKLKFLAAPKIPRVEKVAHFENDIAALK